MRFWVLLHMSGSPTLSMIAAMDTPSLRKVKEEDFQKAICAYASDHGWLVHYQRRSGFVGSDGRWRGSGPAGFPDLVLARNQRPLFIELKAQTGRLRPDQVSWSAELGEHYWRFWKPSSARAAIEELE